MFIDAAHDPRIYPAIAGSSHTRRCLFSEEHITDDIKAVSPFLVKIKHLDECLNWCLREGLHRHWITFFASDQGHVSELCLHFKRYSIAHTPDNKRYFFRFYDPRVLPSYVASQSQGERADFFRACRAFWVPQTTQQNRVQPLQIEADGRQSIVCSPVEVLSKLKVATA